MFRWILPIVGVILGPSLALAVDLDTAAVCTASDNGGPQLIPSSIQRPVYPAEAIRLNLQGVTTLQILVDAKGIASDARVVQSSGSQVLDNASIQRVRTFIFRPAVRDGETYACVKWINMPWEMISGSLAVPEPEVITKHMGPDQYPPDAKASGAHGTTIIKANFDDHGRMIQTTTIQSSGSKILDDAADQSARSDHTFVRLLQLESPPAAITFKYEWSLDKDSSQATAK